jgi:hypothetical protein
MARVVTPIDPPSHSPRFSMVQCKKVSSSVPPTMLTFLFIRRGPHSTISHTAQSVCSHTHHTPYRSRTIHTYITHTKMDRFLYIFFGKINIYYKRDADILRPSSMTQSLMDSTSNDFFFPSISPAAHPRECNQQYSCIRMRLDKK